MPLQRGVNIFLMIRAWALFMSTQDTMAQSAQPDSEKTVPRVTLEETIVTALRQPETALVTPLAVTVVSNERLAASRGFGLDEALSLVPGVLAQSRTGNQDVRVMIRGFGARGAGERSNAGTSRGIRVYVDGFPETEPDGRTSFDLVEIANAHSIEVLRSNASTLWGNAAGGVINIRTTPVSETPFLEIQPSFGSFGFRKTTLHAAIPFHQGVMHLSLNRTQFDGWREQSQSERTQCNGGITISTGAASKLGVFLNGVNNRFYIPGPLTAAQFESAPQQAQADPKIYSPTYVERRERRFNRLGRIGVSFDHQFDDTHGLSATAFVQPKYLQRSERNTFRDFNRYHVGGSLVYRNASRLSQNLESHFLAGVDEQYQDGAVLFYNLVNGERGPTLRNNQREGANNAGVFVQEELAIGQKVILTAGARYDNITYYNEDYLTPELNATKSFEKITPKLGFLYRLHPLLSFYANLGGGVEVPAGNETDPPSTFGEDTLSAVNSLLEPIRSRTMEIGVKSIFSGNPDGLVRGLSYDAAFYVIDVTNDIIPYRGGRFYFTAGESRRLGVELGLSAELAAGFSLSGAMTYARNTFVDYKVDSVHYDQNAAGKFANYGDNDMPGIPNFFATVRMRCDLGLLPRSYVEFEMRTVGKYFADDANTLPVRSSTVFDAVVGFEKPLHTNLGLKGFFRINNLADKKYIASIWINPDRPAGGDPAFIEPGLPRNLAGGLALIWNL